MIIGGAVILTAANVASGGTLTPLQVALIAGASGAVIEGGSEILDELHDGEPINWGAVAARTVGGGAKGAMFSVPGLGTAKLAAGTVGIATAENYLHSAAKGDVSAEALGKALADGTIEGITAGLVDAAAKKVWGAQMHAEPKPKPESQMQSVIEVEQEPYFKPDIQLFAGNDDGSISKDIFEKGKATFDKFNIEDAYVKPKHLSTTSGKGRQFLGETKQEAEIILKNAIQKGKICSITDNGITAAGNQSYEIIIDSKSIIGTKGENLLKIILSEDGGMLSAYPIK